MRRDRASASSRLRRHCVAAGPPRSGPAGRPGLTASSTCPLPGWGFISTGHNQSESQALFHEGLVAKGVSMRRVLPPCGSLRPLGHPVPGLGADSFVTLDKLALLVSSQPVTRARHASECFKMLTFPLSLPSKCGGSAVVTVPNLQMGTRGHREMNASVPGHR